MDARAPSQLSVRASDLAGDPPPQPWHVRDWIPRRNITLLYGDGGDGKSLLALQLAVATVIGGPWLGLAVEQGPAIFLSAEDELEEIHRRLSKISERLTDLDDLRIIPVVDREAVLATANAASGVTPTLLFHQLADELNAIRPRLLILDTLADVFGGDEINRSQVRQFIGMLRREALKHDAAVLVLAHPSATGIVSGRGSSGSTGWSNSVRSRLYLHRGNADQEADPDVRILQNMKSNYSRKGGEIRIEWTPRGFTLSDARPMMAAARDTLQEAEGRFMELLAAYTVEGRSVGASPGANYAPALFARDARSKGVSKKAFVAGMNQLFANSRIQVVPYGPPSRGTKRVEAVVT